MPEQANPYADDPHTAPPYSAYPSSTNPYDAANPYTADPYAANPYAADPFAANPYAQQYAPAGPTLVPASPSLSDAFSWAWRKFSASAGVIIGAAALWALLLVALFVVGSIALTMVLFAGFSVNDDWLTGGQAASTAVGITLAIVITVLATVVMALALSCWLNAMIIIADGRRPELADFARPVALGPIVVISLILGVVNGVANVVFIDLLGMEWLSWIVAIVLGLCTMWMVYQAADARLPVGDALRKGLDLAVANPGTTLLVMVITGLLALAGLLALVVGLLVALPVGVLLTLYYFRALSGRPIAE